jgi:DNA helicase-2/ATP-dependent DNA helicase PcrA
VSKTGPKATGTSAPTFEAEINRLNPAQRAAVEQVEGTVLVVAGPGTGKTHLLAARIGRILQLTDAYPHNVLCLTYTDAGVRAMRQRLLSLIGPTAHKLHIFTFHSFCNAVIQENMERFGRRDMEPISDLEQVLIVRQLLDELPREHPLAQVRQDAYYYERHLRDLFKRMKTEGWQPDFIAQKVQQYLAELPLRKEFVYQVNGKNFLKGSPKLGLVADAREKMERLAAAAALYPAYSDKMRAARRYDFDDMVLWVLRAFEEDELLLRRYQEQYTYLLVDEYQDTNGTQNAILQKLADFWENPNLFVVGDDDQSIFEFQGARLKNILHFYDRYADKGMKTVVLAENYRSSQHILDAARSLIEGNALRLVANMDGLEKILTAKNPYFSASALRPQVTVYKNRPSENADIANQIEALWQQGMPLSEIAVIYAQHKQANDLIALCQQKKIAYTTKRQVNVLDLPLVQNIRLFLEYVYNEARQPHSGEQLLFQIMHFDFFGLPIDDLHALHFHLAKNEGIRWREAIIAPAILDATGFNGKEKLALLAGLINDGISDLRNAPTLRLVERFINQSGLLAQASAAPDKEWQLQVLGTFFDFVESESSKRPRLSLRQLLDTLKSMDDNRIPLGANRLVGTGQGVNFLTAHAAKGLEFQVVFIIDLVKDFWEPSKRMATRRFAFPDTITFSGEEDAMEARRRLLYVAMTRAKEQLYISYSTADKSEADLDRACFIDEVLECGKVDFLHKTLPAAAMAEAQRLRLSETKRPNIDLLDSVQLDELLEGFTLNISALNRYLRCPLSFYYADILKVPASKSEAAAYGNAVHFALRRLFEKAKPSKNKRLPEEAVLLADFEREMQRQRNAFSEKGFSRHLQRGLDCLGKYYRHHRDQWHKQFMVEYDMKHVLWKGVPLSGTVDKLELHDAFADRIVDYKTGRHDAAKTRRPSSKNRLGGAYWRQLVFYKILYENHRNTGRIARQGEIEYIEPNSQGEFAKVVFDFTQRDVALLSDMIVQAWEGIQAHEFREGCGLPNCKWCGFAKRLSAPSSFNDEEAEALDD